MIIQKSAEDYLEAVLILEEEQGYVRSVDVAKRLKVSKASVSNAVKNLRENGYLTVDCEGRISLTETGLEIAAKIYERHKLLTGILVRLGVDEATAEEDACKIEHDISEESFDAVCNYIKNL